MLESFGTILMLDKHRETYQQTEASEGLSNGLFPSLHSTPETNRKSLKYKMENIGWVHDDYSSALLHSSKTIKNIMYVIFKFLLTLADCLH